MARSTPPSGGVPMPFSLWAIPLFNVPRERIPDLAARARLPAMYLLRSQVEAGGLMSYGPNSVEMDRRAAWYVDKLLGLAAPPSVLQRADHVIE
jgi:hypothetical protein